MSVEFGGEDYNLSVKSLLAMLWRRLWLVVLIVVFSVGVALGISFIQTPKYEASITILVGQDQGFTETPNDALGIQTLTQTIAGTVGSTRVAEAVIQDLDLNITPEDFLENVGVEQVPETQLVEVTYQDPSANDAQLIVNSIGDEFSRQIAEASPQSSAITAVPWDEAVLPEDTVTPNPLRNGLLGLMVGLFLGLGIAILIEFFDDSWRSPEELESISGVPTFGIIPHFEMAAPKKRQRRSSGKSPETRSASVKPPKDGEARVGVPERAFEGTASWPYFGTVLLDREGNIQKCNPTVCQMLGMEMTDIRGQNIATLASHPDDVQDHASQQAALSDKGSEGYQVEKRLVTTSGELIWVKLSVSKSDIATEETQFAFGTLEDISQKKQAEEELRLSEEARKFSEARLKAFIKRSPFAIQTFTVEGHPLMNGEAWNEFWAYDLRDVPGNDGSSDGVTTEVVNLFEQRRVKESGVLTYVRRSIESSQPVETPLLKQGEVESDDVERWFRAFITPVSDDQERVTEVVVAISDMTDYENSQKELERMRLEKQDYEKALELRESALREREEMFRSLVAFTSDLSNGNSSTKGSD